MTDIPLIEQDCAASSIVRALGLFMGNGRRHSVAEVSEMTGIPTRTLSSYIASGFDRRTPTADKMLVLMHALGPEFSSKLLSAIGQGAHDLVMKHQQPNVVIATLAGGTAMLAEMAADGTLDHRERLALEPVADEIIQTLLPFSTRSSAPAN